MQIAYDNKRRTLNRKFAKQGHRFIKKPTFAIATTLI
jgi:hypothetical protein